MQSFCRSCSRHIGKGIVIFQLLSLFIPQTMMAADHIDDAVERLKTSARIDWHQVSSPLGRILLVRKGKDICAIRFTEYHRGHDAKPPSIFNSGEESFYAEYDWYCQTDGSQDLKKKNVASGHRKLVEKPSKGIGRLAFQTGTVNVKCGPFKLFWMFPTSISFSASPSCSDPVVQLSPTKWMQIEDIDLSYSKLKWFDCDERRKTINISIDEL